MTYSTALLPWARATVGALDDQLLFYALQRSLEHPPDFSDFAWRSSASKPTPRRWSSPPACSLERDPAQADSLDACMRAVHSLKGAARTSARRMRVAHAMEDCFVAAQQGRVTLGRAHIDVLLATTDLLIRIARTDETAIGEWEHARRPEIDAQLAALARVVAGEDAIADTVLDAPAARAPAPAAAATEPERPDLHASDRVLRVTAENLNRLLSLAGESLVESRWIKPFGGSLLQLKRRQHDLTTALDLVRHAIADGPRTPRGGRACPRKRAGDRERAAGAAPAELEMFDRRSIDPAHRLYGRCLPAG